MTTLATEISTITTVTKYKNIDFGDFTFLDHDPYGRRRSIIICTIGDPNITVVDIQQMMEAGMNVARFLHSHTTTEDRVNLIGKIDKAANVLAKKNGLQHWPCATCIELNTCLINTGLLEQNRPYVILKEKSLIILTYNLAEFDKCNEKQIFVSNPYIVTDTAVGMEISITQDKIILRVTKINEDTVSCVVIKEGMLYNLETVCMTGARRTRPYITKKDLELAKFAVQYQVDMMLVNYTRHPETIRQIKKYIGPKVKKPFIICGICTYEGLCNLDDIIKETDALLLSRELLAYELDRQLFYRMGQIQKKIIGKCRQAGKPLFISGQIFETTLTTGLLSHHDVSDVVNSILEGASGFMINAWHDVYALKSALNDLSSICAEIEPLTNTEVDFQRNLLGMRLPLNAAMATAVASILLVNQSLSKLMVVPTVSGHTIYHLNCMRPSCTIIAVTTNIKAFRVLKAFRCVLPLFCIDECNQTWDEIMKARIAFAVNFAVDKCFLKYGDLYVTLEKGSENSYFCDTIRSCKVVTKRSERVRCRRLRRRKRL